MQFGYVPPRQAIAENLLINPRGLINQANEADGVIAAGDYFCDGWKAGPAGCEVYRLAGGGFDLRSGSIVQLIPNNLEASRLVRTNLDIVTGSPVIKVNGTADKAQAGAGEYIEIEISGDNSQFNRIVAADSQVKPVYQQSSDELTPCLKFFFTATRIHIATTANLSEVPLYHARELIKYPVKMHESPAISIKNQSNGAPVNKISQGTFSLYGVTLRIDTKVNYSPADCYIDFVADARP